MLRKQAFYAYSSTCEMDNMDFSKASHMPGKRGGFVHFISEQAESLSGEFVSGPSLTAPGCPQVCVEQLIYSVARVT